MRERSGYICAEIFPHIVQLRKKFKYMKNKLLIIYASVFVLIIGMNACHSELDINDPNRLSSAEYYQNEGQAVAAVDAIYNVLIIDGLYQRITPIYNDGRGDELGSRSPWSFMTGFSSFTLPATDGAVDIFWQGHYIMISRANQVLENIPGIENVDAT